MLKFLLIFSSLLGMAILVNGQNIDQAYQAKLKSLYKGTIPVIESSLLAQYLTQDKPHVLLDTRTPREFEVSHLPDARFIDYGHFSKNDVASIDHNMPIVVYCTVGYRSERIGEQLKKLGFKTVFNLYGGIFEWVNQGNEVVDANGKPTQNVHAYSKDWGIWLKKGEKIYQ